MAASPTVRGLVSVYWLKSGAIVDIDLLGSTVAASDMTIPRRASRVVFEVSPVESGSILFKLSQGGLVVEENCTEDTLFVFDIVKAP